MVEVESTQAYDLNVMDVEENGGDVLGSQANQPYFVPVQYGTYYICFITMFNQGEIILNPL